MSQNENVKDRRKYQRVLVEPSSKTLVVDVVGYGQTLVFDMSYTGAAFAQPKEKKVASLGDVILLHLKTEIDEAEIKAKVIRVSEEVIAVEFSEISVEARVIIDRVVTDRIIGINMRLIDSKHYNVKADFTHWFHGPKETNLYFWWAQEKLLKVQMDMDTSLLFYEANAFFFENKVKVSSAIDRLNNIQIAHKALAIVEQIESDLKPLMEFKKILKNHVQS